MSDYLATGKQRELNFLFIDIVNALSKDQQEDLLRVYRPAAICEPESLRRECHSVIRTLLVAKECSIEAIVELKDTLKRLGRDDLAKICNKCLEKVKKADKKASKTPNSKRKAEQPQDHLSQRLVQAKGQIFALLIKSSEAIDICEEKLRKFRNNETTEQDVLDTFRRFDNIVERSTMTLEKGISGSSLHSDNSDTGSTSPEEQPVGQAPIQETWRAITSELSRKTQEKKSLLAPPVVMPDGQIQVQPQEEKDHYAPLEEIRRVPGDVEKDNTGDSGLGSNEGNRDEWLKGSHHPDSPVVKRNKPMPLPKPISRTNPLPRRKIPPPGPGEYAPIQSESRDAPNSYTATLKPNSIEDILAQLAQRRGE